MTSCFSYWSALSQHFGCAKGQRLAKRVLLGLICEAALDRDTVIVWFNAMRTSIAACVFWSLCAVCAISQACICTDTCPYSLDGEWYAQPSIGI